LTRGEWKCIAIFTSELESKRETRAEIIDEDSFGELTGPVYFVGDCSEKAQTVLIKENFTFEEINTLCNEYA
jgi:tRNA threonylcarbamoyladenosine biosynthesis protein TsaB